MHYKLGSAVNAYLWECRSQLATRAAEKKAARVVKSRCFRKARLRGESARRK